MMYCGFTKIDGGFWGRLIARNRTATLPHAVARCEEADDVAHFQIAAGRREGVHAGEPHADSDLYKVLEGVCYAPAQHADPALAQVLDAWIPLIAEAQDPDGYLNTYYTTHRDQPRYGDIYRSHELYSAGHLIEAAVAHHEVTGERRLLEVATRLADHLDATFGPGKCESVPGHQEVELALVRLWEATGEARYLALARFFVDMRGNRDRVRRDYAGMPIIEGDRRPGRNRPPEYRQDHLPTTEQRSAVGHAVRAGYFYAAMADIARECASADHAEAARAIWQDIVSRHLYITGGVGTHQHRDEGFGAPYLLPNDTAYCETCGGIALMLFSHRMGLLDRHARYADLTELILYNHMLACPDLEGRAFHYRNPLASDGSRRRHPWPQPACCPTNIVRMIPQIGRFAYGRDGNTLYVDQFVQSRAELALDSGPVGVTQETRYPWDGRVELVLQPGAPQSFACKIRIPGWVDGRPVPSDLYAADEADGAGVAIALNGAFIDTTRREAGYVAISRTWQPGDRISISFAMPVRRIRAHQKVQADEGRVALMRGPLVYCLEAVDVGRNPEAVTLSADSEFRVAHVPDLLGGVTVVSSMDGAMTAVPYHAWNNREPGGMVVWIREAGATGTA